MKDWHVGQRVVCVNATDSFVPEKYSGKVSDLIEGRVYTIRRIGIENHFGIEIPSLWLEEVIRVCNVKGIDDMGSNQKRFRPLDESRLDQFRVYLNPKKVEEPA